jgi:hypothetical protein
MSAFRGLQERGARVVYSTRQRCKKEERGARDRGAILGRVAQEDARLNAGH